MSDIYRGYTIRDSVRGGVDVELDGKPLYWAAGLVEACQWIDTEKARRAEEIRTKRGEQ